MFSTKVTITRNVTEEIKLRVVAETQESTGIVQGFSAIFLLDVVEHINSEDDEVLENMVDSSLVRMKELFENEGNSLTTSISNTILQLKTLNEVDNAYLNGGQMLIIEYSSGLSAGIIFSEVDEQGRILTQGNSLITELSKSKLSNKFIPQQKAGLIKHEAKELYGIY